MARSDQACRRSVPRGDHLEKRTSENRSRVVPTGRSGGCQAVRAAGPRSPREVRPMETPMQRLSQVLWRERELLEGLQYALEVEQLILATGRNRWLMRA